MAQITLSNGLVATVDDADYASVAAHTWHAVRNTVGVVYAFRQTGGRSARRTLYMHREVLGVTDRRVEVDHVNGQALDNTRANLRACGHGQNQRNYHRRKGGFSSRFKGVFWHTSRGLWCAQIKLNRKRHYLGQFSDETEAARAYNAAALRLHGAFACPNVIA